MAKKTGKRKPRPLNSRAPKKKFNWRYLRPTAKQTIAIIILLGFGFSFYVTLKVVPLSVYYSPPPLERNQEITETYQLEGYPLIGFTAIVNFQANGGFSVGNPINFYVFLEDIHVLEEFPVLLNETFTIINATGGEQNSSRLIETNETIDEGVMGDFLATYNCLSFADAYPVRNQTENPYTGRLYNAVFPIRIDPNDTDFYYATGTFYFSTAENVYMDLLPNCQQSVVYPISDLTQGPAYITISPFSDTLSIQTVQNTVRLQWVLSTFGILLLQPIVEAIWFKEDRGTNSGHEDNYSKTEP